MTFTKKTEAKKLHWLMQRFLNKNKLQINLSPDNSQWEKFIISFSKILDDYDQDHYLLERSMRVSSEEMRQLNEKLENAQHIAHMGYWLYDRETGRVNWSNETFYLMEVDLSQGEPTYEEIMKKIYKEDRIILEKLIQKAFQDGMDYEIEFRIPLSNSDDYRWLYGKGHPHIENASMPIRYLSGIVMDITERKKSEEALKKMHQQLLSTARQAGMAEVATSVLHNVGNILNSANVSLGVLKETTEKTSIQKLLPLAHLLLEHRQDTWIKDDPKGQKVPEYFYKLTEIIIKDHELLVKEISNLEKQIQHICDIVALQKDISGLSGLAEKIYVPEIIEMAIQMSTLESSKEILIMRQFSMPIFLIADRARLLQILVNLLRNAKDALKEISTLKKITIETFTTEEQIKIIVTDTGVGIPKENLTKIFSLGYTTKKHGHGFGLHASAIAAKELGGKLFSKSPGKGKGAIFTLELPLSPSENKINTGAKNYVAPRS